MPIFEYRAINDEGKVVQAAVEALNTGVVAEQLEKLGYIPLKISEQKGSLLNFDLFGKRDKVKTDDIILFTKQLVTLLKAGVPLLSCLEALLEQADKPGLRKTIEELYSDVESGISLSEAMAKHPSAFPNLYVHSIKAGEMSGALDKVLERLALLLEHDKATRSKVKAAMRYPIIVVSSLCVAFLILITLVVPKFVVMFTKAGVQLPLPTRILIGINEIIHNYWHVGIVTIVVVIIGFKQYIKTEQGCFHWDNFKLKMPLFGNLTHKAAMSRFSRMFQTLNSSGLPILQTLEIVAKTVGNLAVGKEVERASLGIRKGEGIAAPLKQSKMFPPMVIKMISIGEQSGSLDDMLLNISEHYDLEVDYAVKGLTTMIEPLLTVALGVIVLFLALGIFLPMWDLTKFAQ